jgi:hypothetical protein
METIQFTATAEEVVDHHFNAFLKNDVEEIMKDYVDDSEIWTSEGRICGLDAIANFFSYAFTVLPSPGTQFGVKQKLVKHNWVYLAWNADSPVISIPTGADTFVVEGGKIMLQTVATHLMSK